MKRKIILIFLVVIILVEIITLGAIIYFRLIPKLTTPTDSIQTVQEQAAPQIKILNEKNETSSPTTSFNFYTTPSPTSIPSNIFNFSKLPQAKSLDVNLNVSGLSLQTFVPSANEASDLSTLNGPNYYETRRTGKYYEQLLPKGASMTSSNPEGILTSQLSNIGWETQLLQNGDGFSGPQAGGHCGNVESMIGYNNDKIRFVTISSSVNPCMGDDGSEISFQGQPVGENYQIFVSDIIDVNDLVSDFNSRP